jgi:2-dehydropantoate 2-reductase
VRVGVIGGGSIGLLFAYYSSYQHDVTIFTRTKKQADSINQKGIVCIKGENTYRKKIQAVSIEFGKSLLEQDLIVVSVKQYHLNGILPHLQSTKADLLFLQNGMGHLEKMVHLHNPNIFLGIVEHGALRLDENVVKHTGVGQIKIAPYRGEKKSFLLQTPHKDFPFILEDHYYGMLIEKLLANAAINPLTAILEVENGKLISNPYYKELMGAYVKELCDILNLHEKEGLEYIEEICKKTAHNRSSMLRDIEEKRETEIDAIVGYVLHVAQKENKNAPLSKLLYSMVKGKELLGKGK